MSIFRLKKNYKTGLGIKVTEGTDGCVYIQALVPNGAAEKSGLIYIGKVDFVVLIL